MTGGSASMPVAPGGMKIGSFALMSVTQVGPSPYTALMTAASSFCIDINSSRPLSIGSLLTDTPPRFVGGAPRVLSHPTATDSRL